MTPPETQYLARLAAMRDRADSLLSLNRLTYKVIETVTMSREMVANSRELRAKIEEMQRARRR